MSDLVFIKYLTLFSIYPNTQYVHHIDMGYKLVTENYHARNNLSINIPV